jgi:hypothetical protein
MIDYRRYIGVLAVCTLLLTLSFDGRCQGSFQNLDFESANVPYPTSGVSGYPFAEVLPSWTGYLDTNQAAGAVYNGVSGGGTLTSLVTADTTYPNDGRVIAGRFTAALSAGYYGLSNPILAPAAIAQTSLTPVTAKSLTFAAFFLGTQGDLAITLDGVNIPFVALGAGPNYTIYGGDVSALAGLTGELRFSERPISNPSATVFLDNIQFSDQPIPEPGTVALLGLGASLLAFRLLWRRNCTKRGGLGKRIVARI